MKHDVLRFAPDPDTAPPRIRREARAVGDCISPLVGDVLDMRAKAQRRPRAAHTLRAWLAHEVAQCRDDAALQRLMIARGYAIYLGKGGTLICTSDGEPICPFDAIRPGDNRPQQ